LLDRLARVSFARRAPVASPADAALGGGWEQRLRRRANVGRAMVPEHRQVGVGIVRHGVVIEFLF
jgi:hypothetical protein